MIKIIFLKISWLKINTSFYCLLRGLRAIYCLGRNSRRRIREARSGSQVIDEKAVSTRGFPVFFLN